jgi:hypothetical protein
LAVFHLFIDMHHHDCERRPLPDRLQELNSHLAAQVRDWQDELSADQYRNRIRRLFDDLNDARFLEGDAGDAAALALPAVRDELERLRQRQSK